MKPAKQFSMNTDDWKSLGKAVLKYTSPLLIVFLIAIQNGTPLKQALLLVWGAVLQLLINFLSKFTDKP